MYSFIMPKLPLRLTLPQIIIIVTTILSAIIPITAFVLSRNFRSNSAAASRIDVPGGPVTKDKTASSEASLGDLLQAAQDGTALTPSPTPTTEDAVLVGPTLDFKVVLEGRPLANQATKMFVGIANLPISDKPDYLLTFTADLPATGVYKGLSLAGLTVNSRYVAYLKGPAQIATSSAFTVTPTTSTLNPSGDPILLTSGDLNEDNVINSLDLSIAQKALSSTAKSANWNPNVDFNADGIINVLDLAIIKKHLGNTGDSGAWYSTISTPSASPTTSGGGPKPPAIGSGSQYMETTQPPGFWLWFPNSTN